MLGVAELVVVAGAGRAEGVSSSGGGVRERSIVSGVPGISGVCITSSWAPESPNSGGGVRGLIGRNASSSESDSNAARRASEYSLGEAGRARTADSTTMDKLVLAQARTRSRRIESVQERVGY